MGSKKINIAVMLSGSGTTYQYIQDQIDAGALDAKTVVVISSRDDAYGLERAKKHGVPAIAVSRKKFNDLNPEKAVEMFGKELLQSLEPYNIDLIVMAGFMSFLSPEFIEKYRNRIINTHPALIPAFSGENFYGDKVHRAVVEKGVKLTGCTIHFVDEIYDHGQIIIQRAIPVDDTDDYKAVAAKVQAAEKPAFCEAIQLFAEGRLKIVGTKVVIRKPGEK